MNLYFEKVSVNEDKKIEIIYDILNNCGEYMYKSQGLRHWRTPYPIESIKKNCKEREVFLAKDLDANQYVHTFQLGFKASSLLDNTVHNVAIINKFATISQAAGKGIGKQSVEYIENYCRDKNVSKLCLDVYDKSEHAIMFYKNRGFIVIGSKPTRYFRVYLMEKQL